MGYALYLAGCVLLSVLAILAAPSLAASPPFNAANLPSFLDLPTLVLLLAFCALVLAGAGALRPFGRAVGAAFRRTSLPAPQARESLAAWKLAARAALLAGGLGFLINLVPVMHSLEDPDAVGLALNLACLSPTYALFLDLLLLPVGVRLRRQTEALPRDTSAKAPRPGRRKAG